MDYSQKINDIGTQLFGHFADKIQIIRDNSRLKQMEVTFGERVYEIYFAEPTHIENHLFFFQNLKQLNVPTIDVVHNGRISPELGVYMIKKVKPVVVESKNAKKYADLVIHQLQKVWNEQFSGFGKVKGTLQFFKAEYETLYGFIDGQIKHIYDHVINYNQEEVEKYIAKLLDYRHIISESEKASLVHGDISPFALIPFDDSVLLVNPGDVRLAHPAWDAASILLHKELSPGNELLEILARETSKMNGITDNQRYFFVIIQALQHYIHLEPGISAQQLLGIIDYYDQKLHN